MQTSIPDTWYAVVDKSKEKARKLINQIVAINQSTSIVVGKLESVEIDRLWHLKYPYCRLTMRKPVRYRLDGRLEFKMGEQELLFVNKPEMVMNTAELSKTHPRIYEDILPKIKTGVW